MSKIDDGICGDGWPQFWWAMPTTRSPSDDISDEKPFNTGEKSIGAIARAGGPFTPLEREAVEIIAFAFLEAVCFRGGPVVEGAFVKIVLHHGVLWLLCISFMINKKNGTRNQMAMAKRNTGAVLASISAEGG